MRGLRLIALAAIAALVLGSTAGLVAHDHLLELEPPAPAAALCSTDHRASSDADQRHRLALVERAEGAGHQHDCVGCHLNRVRTLHRTLGPLAGSPFTVAQRLTADPESAPVAVFDARLGARAPPLG